MSSGPLAAACLRSGPQGLMLSEQLVLAGLRAWVEARRSGCEPRPLVRPGLSYIASQPAAAMFMALMESLERNGLRPMRVHCGACQGYSHDEQRIVLACGLAPVEPQMAVRLLKPLVRAPEGSMILARTLNIALRHAGFAFPARLNDEVAASATLH